MLIWWCWSGFHQSKSNKTREKNKRVNNNNNNKFHIMDTILNYSVWIHRYFVIPANAIYYIVNTISSSSLISSTFCWLLVGVFFLLVVRWCFFILTQLNCPSNHSSFFVSVFILLLPTHIHTSIAYCKWGLEKYETLTGVVIIRHQSN